LILVLTSELILALHCIALALILAFDTSINIAIRIDIEIGNDIGIVIESGIDIALASV